MDWMGCMDWSIDRWTDESVINRTLGPLANSGLYSGNRGSPSNVDCSKHEHTGGGWVENGPFLVLGKENVTESAAGWGDFCARIA